jgi:tryptophan-rich hypothetical protein
LGKTLKAELRSEVDVEVEVEVFQNGVSDSMQSKYRHFSKKLFEINSNWTSVKNLEGWNHYRIAGRRRTVDRKLELEMMAVCDREIRIWIPRAQLRDPHSWKPGWIEPTKLLSAQNEMTN